MIFKQMNSSKELQIIKYNPDKILDSMFRFYTSNIVSEDGHKVPYIYAKNNYLKKVFAEINTRLAYRTSIGFYYKITKLNEGVVFNLYENGDIEFYLNLNTVMTIEDIETFFDETMNKMLIYEVNKILYKIGLKINNLDTLFSQEVSINNINYIGLINKKNEPKINLSKYMKCLQLVFSMDNDRILTKSGVINTYVCFV